MDSKFQLLILQFNADSFMPAQQIDISNKREKCIFEDHFLYLNFNHSLLANMVP